MGESLKNPDRLQDRPFVSLLDIDPHERLGELEKEVEGMPSDTLLMKGLNVIETDSLLALVCLERAALDIHTPELASALGFCLAKERAQFGRAVELCRSAIAMDPSNTAHYLHLGRVYLMQGKKNEAIEIYKEGLTHGENAQIREDLGLIGLRRRPVIPLLRREHALNRSLGFILDKISRKKR